MRVSLEHDRINQLLPLYANGSLDAASRRQVAAHLETCAECREELNFLGDVRHALRRSAAADEPARRAVEPGFETLPVDLQQRVVAHRRDATDRRRRWAVIGLAATLLIAVSAGVTVSTLQHEQPLYRTATSSMNNSGDHVLVSVQFSADIEFRQVNELLRRNRAVIVRGPDARDRWVLEIPVRGDSEARDVVSRLRKSAGIESVEPGEAPVTVE